MDEPTAGLCACGCGEPTNLAPVTRSQKGWVKGQPLRWLKGHDKRKTVIDNRSWASKADFLVAHLDERLAKRFWAKVNKDGPVPAHRPELGPCWLWTAARHKKTGYGSFSVGAAHVRQNFMTHRVAAALDGRVASDDLMVCHHCDNPQCVRPDHLFIGTHVDNMDDMRLKGRGRKPLDVCKQGHELTDENTYVYNGHRACKKCHQKRCRAWHQARKGEDAA